MMKITKKTKIVELVSGHPEAVGILMERGFHCIGCAMASFETLEEGAKAHGMNDEQIEALVKELNLPKGKKRKKL